MPQLVLTALKFLFLALLYLFLARAVRVIYLDLVGPRAPRPQKPTAPADAGKRKRAAPKSVVVRQGDDEAQTIPVAGESLTIGRAESCEIVLADNYASQFHARIYSQDGAWFVEDLGSTNGTYLNRVKVTHPSPFASGDEIRIGKTTIEARR